MKHDVVVDGKSHWFIDKMTGGERIAYASSPPRDGAKEVKFADRLPIKHSRKMALFCPNSADPK